MAYWTCAQLVPGREKLALHCLSRVNGFEIYSPRIPAPQPKHRRKRDDDARTLPLFPGYVFVLVIEQWWAARWSPGVVRIILDGIVPARVPDNIIAGLRQREHRGVVQLPEPPKLRRGAPLRVINGPLVGFVGLYQGMTSHERIAILLGILGGAVRVTLSEADVQAL
jgi:transcription antitermination factor NusG